MSSIRDRPWNVETAPLPVRQSAGMISAAEKNMLHWLAKNYVNGSGHILDVGCFLGASTMALASGVAENPKWPDGRKILAFDNFQTTEGMINLHPEQMAGKKPGDSFLDVFSEITQSHARHIEPQPCDLMTLAEFPAPIELLFIDASKTPALNSRIVDLGFPRLVPGHSLVVQQDYIFEVCPWIVATMEYFADRFEFVDFAFGASCLYRLTDKITADDASAFASLSLHDMAALHKSAQERIRRDLDTIAGGTISPLAKGIIHAVMRLSFLELLRLTEGRQAAVSAFNEMTLDDMGQDHMRNRIDKMARRIGV